MNYIYKVSILGMYIGSYDSRKLAVKEGLLWKKNNLWKGSKTKIKILKYKHQLTP